MRTLTFVVCELGAAALTGRVAFVNEFETVKFTVAFAPGASGPYGFDVASAVTPLGSVSVTVPDCAVVARWGTSGGSVRFPRLRVFWMPAEGRSRRACGAAVCTQL